MRSSQPATSHALNLVMRMTQADDGAHAKELLEIIDEVADPANEAGNQIKNYLRSIERHGLSCSCGGLDCG